MVADFENFSTGEIKSQTVFMGDFPLMTDKGTFIVNGSERVVVSQLVRSPGVYFERTTEKASDKYVYNVKFMGGSSGPSRRPSRAFMPRSWPARRGTTAVPWTSARRRPATPWPARHGC